MMTGVKKPRKRVTKVGRQAYLSLHQRYGFKCLACGEEKPLTVDHIVPVDFGGTDGIDNLQLLCGVCNSKKSNSTIDYRPVTEDFRVPTVLRRFKIENPKPVKTGPGLPRGRNGGRRPRSPEAGPFEHVGARLPAEDAAWMRAQARGHPDGVSGLLRDIIHDRIEQERRADRDRPQDTPAGD